MAKFKSPALTDPQFEIYYDPARIKVIAKGRRWGYNDLRTNKALNVSVNGGAACLVSPSYTSNSHLRAWRYLEQYSLRMGIKPHRSDRRIEFPGGGFVVMRSAEYPEGIRGDGYDWIDDDECAFQSGFREMWEQVIRSTIADTGGEAWLASSPNGFDDFQQIWTAAHDLPDWRAWRMPTWTNPFMPKSEIAAMRRDMAPNSFRQEIGAEFVAREGRVFSDFTRETHVRPTPFDPHLDLDLSVDFGRVVHAVGIYQTRGEGIEAEVRKIGEGTFKGKTTQQALEYLKRWKSDRPIPYESGIAVRSVANLPKDWTERVVTIACDPAGESRDSRTNETDAQMYRDAFPMAQVLNETDPVHRSVEWSANRVCDRQFSASGEIREFVDPCCLDSIAAYEGYVFAANGKPHKDGVHDHHCDERRYYELVKFHAHRVTVGSYSRVI